ncbi:hypothetical protein AcV5_010153 [Taiwanofungus camphoratus]|nr:hypothetical protein AcV5_010153 [Antrodia cinnamomea]
MTRFQPYAQSVRSSVEHGPYPVVLSCCPTPLEAILLCRSGLVLFDLLRRRFHRAFVRSLQHQPSHVVITDLGLLFDAFCLTARPYDRMPNTATHQSGAVKLGRVLNCDYAILVPHVSTDPCRLVTASGEYTQAVRQCTVSTCNAGLDG